MNQLKFLGAAGTVTGSKFLLQLDHYKILIDCGLFQGLKYLRDLNREPFQEKCDDINIVLITHAHLDHTGYLPLLVKNGYKGKIVMTAPTAELTEIILKDSAKIQEEDAERANRDGFSKHYPALPLYTTEDAEKCLRQFEIAESEQWISISDAIKIRFRKNGHILGSCFLEIEYKNKMIVFSGDLGRQNSILHPPPLYPDKADILIMESTYGNKVHPSISAEEQIIEVIHKTRHKKGNLLISSFAIGRAQELMLMIERLKKENKIPPVAIYVDSPMSSEATKVMFRYPQWHKISFEECKALAENIIFVRTYEDTQTVINTPGPKIIIAASGMLAGGRILHYLKEYLEDEKNTILLVGFQAEGTRGKALKEGAHELKIHGKYYSVKADVCELSTLSAHADQNELINWMRNLQSAPQKFFLVHGENDALYTLQLKIKDVLGWNAIIPNLGEVYDLD